MLGILVRPQESCSGLRKIYSTWTELFSDVTVTRTDSTCKTVIMSGTRFEVSMTLVDSVNEHYLITFVSVWLCVTLVCQSSAYIDVCFLSSG